MYIRKIYIKEFGALSDREFIFSDGINLLEGSNESGKSTILAFIRFMLYGMPRRAAGETVSERERGLSWTNGIAEGNMELFSGGKLYRIERKGQLRGGTRETYTESCNIFDAETGEEIFKGEVPGKLFLGITSEVFTATACIRQLECTDMNSDEINSSIENLLFAADEEIDTQRVQAKLDDLRRTLLYKNGRGGRLFELEATRSLLENRLESAKQTAETVIAKEAAVEKLKAFSEKSKKQIEETEEQLRLYEIAITLKRFETLHSYEAQYDTLENELERLSVEKGYQNALPDRETLGVIDRVSASLSDATQKHRLAVTALTSAKAAPCGDRALAAIYERTDEEGGKETLSAAFLRAVRKRKGAILRAVLCLILGVLILAAGAFTLVSDLFAAYYAVIEFFPYYLLGAGAILGLLGIFSLSSASKAKKEITSLVGKIGLSGADISLTALTEHIETCRRNHELCQKYDAALFSARETHDSAVAMLEKAVQNTSRMLSSVGISTADESPEGLLSALKQTHETFLAVCQERERIENKLDSLRALIDELRENLKDENEGSLSASVGRRSPSALLADMDIEKLRLAHSYAKTQHTLNEQKKIALEKELIALNSTAENPAKLDAKLNEVVTELNLCRLKYNAIVMAHETLGVASENLHRNVTPKLRIRAGELMEALTGGKYRDLGISTDMKITVVTDRVTRSIDALSKGTRDAAYISLRMALAELICEANMPPLLFDESFTQLDEDRTLAILRKLLSYSSGGTQALIFTCHKREGEMLKELGEFNHINLNQ